MGDLEALYEDVILEHSRSPRNFGKLENPHRHAEGYNASCGDGVEVFLHFDGEVIRAIKFSGEGCAISRASASLMTESVAGLRKPDAMARAEEVVAALSGSGSTANIGRCAALLGVRKFPMRIKCATLPWHALQSALDGD